MDIFPIYHYITKTSYAFSLISSNNELRPWGSATSAVQAQSQLTLLSPASSPPSHTAPLRLKHAPHGRLDCVLFPDPLLLLKLTVT